MCYLFFLCLIPYNLVYKKNFLKKFIGLYCKNKVSLPGPKHFAWLLFPSRFLQDNYSASFKITPVNPQQLMVKINYFVSNSWSRFWLKWVCKWSIKWLLCGSIIKLENFQKPVSDFIFLSSLNCYFQTRLSFLAWWPSRTSKSVFSVFLSLRLKKVVNQPAALCTRDPEQKTDQCKDIAFY